eukprot:6838397-Alexandrium_andersonii.AAC.1
MATAPPMRWLGRGTAGGRLVGRAGVLRCGTRWVTVGRRPWRGRQAEGAFSWAFDFLAVWDGVLRAVL